MDRSNSLSYTAVIAASLALGFWAGRKAATTNGSPSVKPSGSISAVENPAVDEEESDSEVEVDISGLKVEEGDSCKMVFVVRNDLGMTSGKIAAQCSHAALACYKVMQSKNPMMLRQWERRGQTKIALQCESEEELLVMHAQAQSLNLCAKSIQDAGRTQIAAGSRTVLGIIGPGRLVNQITARLRLL